MIRLIAFIIAIVVAAPPSTASVIPATFAFPEVSGNLLPSKGTPQRVPVAASVAQMAEHRLDAPESQGSEVAGSSPARWVIVQSVTVSTEVAGAVSDGPGSTVSPGAKVGTVLQAMKGVATWYDAPTRRDAAAGPALRRAIGPGWRGSWVTVRANGHSWIAVLSDFCACDDRHGKPTLIDLDDVAFARFASLGTGVIDVTVEWQSGPIPELPRTDVAL